MRILVGWDDAEELETLQSFLNIGDNTAVGTLSDDLQAAAMRGLTLEASACRVFAQTYSWATCTQQFVENLNI